MPSHHCLYPTCPSIIASRGYCRQHAHLGLGNHEEKRAANRRYNRFQRDKEAQAFYQSAAWRSTRLNKLAETPVCEWCPNGIAEQVHHVEPVKGNWELRLSHSNLVSVCAECHKRYEARLMALKRRQV